MKTIFAITATLASGRTIARYVRAASMPHAAHIARYAFGAARVGVAYADPAQLARDTAAGYDSAVQAAVHRMRGGLTPAAKRYAQGIKQAREDAIREAQEKSAARAAQLMQELGL